MLIEKLLDDLYVSLIALVWVVFVVSMLSRAIYGRLIKAGWSEARSAYFTRKVIHILAGGLVALCVPFYFKWPLAPMFMAFSLAPALYLLIKIKKPLSWFQDPKSTRDVHFVFMWGSIIPLSWLIDRTFWLGVVPMLFSSWGDGVTGLIRSLRGRVEAKSRDGTLGMLVVNIIVGVKLGLAGVVAGVVSALVERVNHHVDDNVTVPLTGFIILLLSKLLYGEVSFTI